MKILIYGLNYSPELTGVGRYTGEMAAWLALRGHQVRVVTAPPYYPNWHIHETYRKPRYRVESSDGASKPTKVYRCPLWVPVEPSGLARMLHLSSFAVSSIPVMAMQSLWKPDVVFTVEPTFFGAPIALLSAFLSGAASWLHVQDFEVDAAFNLGLLSKEGPVHSVAKGLEGFFTSCFSRVSSISSRMVEDLSYRGDARSRVVLFPNWEDIELIKPSIPGADNRFRERLGLKDKIILLYSGSMGEKQGLEMLAPLTESFKDDRRVHFLFCGDGVYRSRLVELVGHRENVTMLPLQPMDRLNELLNAADIHLLPQRKGTADLAMPSKLNGMLASGRPVIAVADEGTEVAMVASGCGLIVPTEDPVALCAAAAALVENLELRIALGIAAREYAVKHVNKELVLRRFEQEVISLFTPVEEGKEIALA